MARALRRSRCHRQVPAAAPGGQQALREGEGRFTGASDESDASAGGVDAERLHGGGREGVQEGARVQDAAGCEFTEQSVFGKSLSSLLLQTVSVYLLQFTDN